MATLCETERLVLRNYDPDGDAEAAFDMYGDPEVMQFLGRSPVLVESVEVQRERLRTVNEAIAQRGDGSGYWAVALKSTGEVVGTVLLKRLPDADNEPTDDWEVGWHLR